MYNKKNDIDHGGQKMSKPLISVIIPVYKTEKYLQACLDSVLQQTFSDFEIILIDDGSPDGAGIICDEYARKDQRVTVVHTGNAGVSNARNLGVRLSKGKYVTFVDSDDVVENNFIMDFVRNLTDDVDIYIQGVTFCFNDGKIQRIKYERNGTMDVLSAIKVNNICAHGYCHEKLYTTEFIKRNHLEFINDVRFSEDLLFLLTALYHADKVRFIDSVSYHYLIREDGACSGLYSVESEMRCFREFKFQITRISERLNVDLLGTTRAGEIFAMLFARVRNSIYNNINQRNKRLQYLETFSETDFELVKKYSYISNAVIRLLYCILSKRSLKVFDFLLYIVTIIANKQITH